MAEYTIPKPYRDFYVTNPMIELQNNLNTTTETLQTHITDLQNIVMTGYISTDAFEGAGNEVITFPDEKHGFSLTNDASTASNWSADLLNSQSWEQGGINSTTGDLTDVSDTTRTSLFIPWLKGASYTLNAATSGSYSYLIYYYDANYNFLQNGSLNGSTITDVSQCAYIKITAFFTNGANVSVSNFLEDHTGFTVSVTSYTAPEDVTVKVAENVAGIPTTTDGWEQGSLHPYLGNQVFHNAIVRTKDFINVENLQNYTLSGSFSTHSFLTIIYEYKEDDTYLKSSVDFKSLPVTFTTSKDTKKIKIILHVGTETLITPESVVSEMNRLNLTSEPMTVQSNDTRIVTMPAFTSLYIESNVPYHGHALDLAE